MKKNISILGLLTLFACGDSDNAVQPSLLEHYPQNWVLTVDEPPDHYVYIKTNSTNTFRDHVPTSYSLITLAEEEDCNFHIVLSKTEGGENCVTMQLENNKHIWLYAYQSPNKQEYYLGAGYRASETEDPDNDNYKFHVHNMPDVDGVKTVTLESVSLPGWYISDASPGMEWAQNQVTLQEAEDPDEATHWQCR